MKQVAENTFKCPLVFTNCKIMSLRFWQPRTGIFEIKLHKLPNIGDLVRLSNNTLGEIKQLFPKDENICLCQVFLVRSRKTINTWKHFDFLYILYFHVSIFIFTLFSRVLSP